MIRLFPTRTWYRPWDEVAVVLEADDGDRTGLADARLSVTSLAGPVGVFPVTGTGVVALGEHRLGGYGVDLYQASGAILASTAFDVLNSALDRPRYGFLTSFGPQVSPNQVHRHYLRLHLNLAQYYDWAWRHTHLLPAASVGEQYEDSLGNPVSLPMLRGLIASLAAVGTVNLGYTAVYAIEPDEKEVWAAHSLYHPDGSAYALGDPGFLFIADPGDPAWLDHLFPQISAAADELGFDGFHLDQYGWPRYALRADGTIADVAAAFVTFINRVAVEIPAATLIFNNVNGFPLSRTAQARQAALYTEVWEPRTTLGDLADQVSFSRAAARSAGRPPAGFGAEGEPLPTIVSAYLSSYQSAGPRAADDAARLTMATIFSSGASHLLAGETGAILTDPYYPKHHLADETTGQMLENWYSFLVRYGDLLLDPGLEDITGEIYGSYNGGVIVLTSAEAPVSTHPDPGTLWVRVMRVGSGYVVHLINLTGQADAEWDAPKQPIPLLTGGMLRVERTQADLPVWHWADPDRPGPMRRLTTRAEGHHAVCELPPLGAWTLIWLPAVDA